MAKRVPAINRPIRVELLDARSGIVGSMSSLGTDLRVVRTLGSGARPLSEAEWADAERVASRLHTELRRLIAALPEHARHASGMARHINVLRATCQRVVSAVQDVAATPMVLTKLPGVEGLRQFLDGVKRAGVDEADVETSLSAVEALERLITAAGGSQTKLIERIEASGGRAAAAGSAGGGENAGPATNAHREALYLSASAVTGRRCDVSLSVYAFRPSPENPAMLERALAKGLIGSVVTPGGLPMVLSSGDTLKGDEEVRKLRLLGGEGARGRTPEAILRPFTTDPLPMITAGGKHSTLSQVVDPQASAMQGAIDVVTAVRGTHPLIDPDTKKPSLDAVWSLVTCPTAKLVFDVYLHASMERDYRPSIDALLWGPNLDVSEEQKWVIRVPAMAQPRLQMLGRGIGRAASEFYPRHAELTAYFFDHIGWDPDEFLGFRCEAVYPVWRAGYCMGFEWLGA